MCLKDVQQGRVFCWGRDGVVYCKIFKCVFWGCHFKHFLRLCDKLCKGGKEEKNEDARGECFAGMGNWKFYNIDNQMFLKDFCESIKSFAFEFVCFLAPWGRGNLFMGDIFCDMIWFCNATRTFTCLNFQFKYLP